MGETRGRIRRGISFEDHIHETFPRNLQGYLGKEHFWVIGEEVKLSRRATGALFVQLVFPMFRRPGIRKNHRGVPPRFGLEVKFRQEVGMPYPPVGISGGFISDRVRAHGFDDREGLDTIADSVIQARGVTELNQRKIESTGLYLSGHAKTVARPFIEHLVETFPVNTPVQ